MRKTEQWDYETSEKPETLETLRSFAEISFFDKRDEKYSTIETGPRTKPGAITISFDEYSGDLCFFQTKKSPYELRAGFAVNMKTGKCTRDSWEGEVEPLKDPKVLEVLDELVPEYRQYLKSRQGYPETKKMVERLPKNEPIPAERLPIDVVPGDYIVFYGFYRDLYACKASSIEPVESGAGIEWGYKVMSDDPSVAIDTRTFEPSEKDDSYVGTVLSPNSELRRNPEQGIWKISKKEFEEIAEHTKKYMSIDFDPSIEYPLSREEYAIAIALDGMAFERWAAGTESIREKNPQRFEAVTKENLSKAIAQLVSRFGEEALARALEWVAYQHVLRLHTPTQRAKIILAQDNAFGDVHSDILGFRKDISDLASNLIESAHPVAIDMEIDGLGRVGKGVYNAKSVFGDLNLLEILKEQYPNVFESLIDTLGKFPAMDQGPRYGNTTVHPLRAVREFFPDAFAFIKENYTGTLPECEGEGIEQKKP